MIYKQDLVYAHKGKLYRYDDENATVALRYLCVLFYRTFFLFYKTLFWKWSKPMLGPYEVSLQYPMKERLKQFIMYSK